MNLKAHRLMNDWKLVEDKKIGILYLEGIVNSKLTRSERLEGFSFSTRQASDFFTTFELGSVNADFAALLQEEGSLFSDFDLPW